MRPIPAAVIVAILVLFHQLPTCRCKFGCQSAVFCTGKLLHTVQLAELFKDSKTFVDMVMVNSPEVTLKNFDHLMAQTEGSPTPDEIMNFIKTNFHSTSELEPWVPSDFKPNPTFLTKIGNPSMRSFAKNLLGFWMTLGRRIRREVYSNSAKYSIIPVPNGFIIPGGRFREFYYWDSYWIIKGLLISGMSHTVKGMLDNFVSIVNTFGFVPNGGRIYYLDRSQPPMLTLMAAAYVAATRNTGWLKQNLKHLDKELQFWIDHRTVEVFTNNKIYLLARYRSFSDEPRPESYREDVHTAGPFKNLEAKRNCYRSLRTGAEAGWDFSARWFFDPQGGNRANLSYINPSRIVPVDLNAILCKSFHILHSYYQTLKIKARAKYWLEKAILWEAAIAAVLYDEDDGVWFDYDTKLRTARKYFYPSNLSPLWTESYDLNHKTKFAKNAVNYLKREGVMQYAGGVPTSLVETGEQWDYPNAWAPLQSMLIFGLENTGELEAKAVARDLANRWIKTNLKVFETTEAMFEKYDAVFGIYGGGGEYDVQTGFGWSNGVILELIDYYYVKHPK